MSEPRTEYNEAPTPVQAATNPDDLPVDELVVYIEKFDERLSTLKNALATRLEKYAKLAGSPCAPTAPTAVKRRKRITLHITNPVTGGVLAYRGGRRPEWLTEDMVIQARADVAAQPVAAAA